MYGQTAMEIAARELEELIESANANMKSIPGPVYNVKGYGAKGDGVTDDTNSIQKAIDAAVSEGVTNTTHATVFFPAGKYIVTSKLSIGTGFITLQGESQRQSHISLNDGAMFDVTANYLVKFYGLYIENTSVYPSKSLSLSAGESHVVDSCQFKNVAGNTSEILYYQGANVKIRNSNFENHEPNAYCIKVYANSSQININTDIINNHFGGPGKGVIVETIDNTRRPEGLKINGNTFLLTGSEQVTIKSALYVDISNNILDQGSAYSLYINPEKSGIGGLTVCENYFGNTGTFGQTIRFEDNSVTAANTTISDNYFGRAGYAIRAFDNVDGLIVSGNRFKNIEQTTMVLAGTKNVIISDNRDDSGVNSLEISDGSDGGPFIITDNILSGTQTITKTTSSKFKIFNNVGLEDNSPTYYLSKIILLSGGSSAESINVDIPSGVFSAKPEVGFIMGASGLTNEIIGWYDYDNVNTTSNNAVFLVSKRDGSALPNANIRFSIMLGGKK